MADQVEAGLLDKGARVKNALKTIMLVALVMVASTTGLDINVSWCVH